MNARQAVETASAEIAQLTDLPLNTVAGVMRDEETRNYVVSLELIEKRSIPDGMDLLGLYEVTISPDGEMLGFERISVRKRGDTYSSEEY